MESNIINPPLSEEAELFKLNIHNMHFKMYFSERHFEHLTKLIIWLYWMSILLNLLPLSLHTGGWGGLWAFKALSVPPSCLTEPSLGYKSLELNLLNQSLLSTRQPQGRELQQTRHGGLKALSFAAPEHICLGLWVALRVLAVDKFLLLSGVSFFSLTSDSPLFCGTLFY